MLKMGLVFWILMLLWAFLGLLPLFGYHAPYGAVASNALLFVLFFLLGWQVFGAPVSRG